MNSYTDLVARCADVLRQETALLERFAAAQEIVRNASFARDWTNLESMLARLDAYGDEFVALEAERARVFAELGGSEGCGDRRGDREPIGFYAMAARLDPIARKELAELYRRLKIDTLKVRLANEALSSYLAEQRTTLSSFMDAAFPDRRGKIYSRRGAPVHAEMRSIVVNRSF